MFVEDGFLYLIVTTDQAQINSVEYCGFESQAGSEFLT
jgi:hypothetical protein